MLGQVDDTVGRVLFEQSAAFRVTLGHGHQGGHPLVADPVEQLQQFVTGMLRIKPQQQVLHGVDHQHPGPALFDGTGDAQQDRRQVILADHGLTQIGPEVTDYQPPRVEVLRARHAK